MERFCFQNLEPLFCQADCTLRGSCAGVSYWWICNNQTQTALPGCSLTERLYLESLRVMARPWPVPSNWSHTSLSPYPISQPPGQGQYPFLTLLIYHFKKFLFTLQHPGKPHSTNSMYVFGILSFTFSFKKTSIESYSKLIKTVWYWH